MIYLHYHDGIFFQPQSPTCLVEDITEIIRKEQDLSDSQYETDSSLLYSNQQVCTDLICINNDSNFASWEWEDYS
jgi:hypothetical protein